MKRWGRAVMTLALLAFVYLLLNRGSAAPSLVIGEAQVEIIGTKASGYSLCVPYASIQSVSLYTKLEEGELLDGQAEKDLHWGRRQNRALGEYRLCIDPSIERYIVFETAEGPVVFNIESETATEEACTAFEKRLQDLYGEAAA